MRNLLLIILTVIALALVRWLITDVVKAVKKALSSSSSESTDGSGETTDGKEKEAKTGRLVKDPISGIYVDENVAVREEIDGEMFFFESRRNREEYIKRARAGQA